MTGAKARTIFHMDGDAFFVACEVAKNPKLRGVPAVTGEERGIVSALSYEAKALGIVRGMPIFKVRKNFPQVVVLPGDYRSYAIYSQKMFDVVRRYVDDVEEYSIDECFADLTGLDFPMRMTYRQIAEKIKREVVELGLSVSVGVAPTKVLAKVASKWKKPDGLTLITTADAPDYLINVPVEKVWGIGSRTADFLKKRGVETAWDFVKKGEGWVKENMSRPYEVLWQELSGISVMDVDPLPKEVYASIQKTRTFHPPTGDPVFLLSQLSKNIEDACAKARYYALIPNTVSFFLKSQQFRYFSCSVSLLSPSNAPEISIAMARQNFRKMYSAGVLYRTTGVTLEGLVPESASQQNLFGGSKVAHSFEAVHKRIDMIDQKFGKHTVYLASTHEALKHEALGTEPDADGRDLLFL